MLFAGFIVYEGRSLQRIVREDGGGCRVWLGRAKDSYPSPNNNKFNVIFPPKPAIPRIEILAQV
jgi:hypothetical protein